MPITSLSEEILSYISVTYAKEEQVDIFSSFDLLDQFGNKFYEQKYIELISRYDSISTSDKRDNFLLLLTKDVLDIVVQHGLNVNFDSNPSLEEINEICHFLYIVQNIEDYSFVTYVVNSGMSDKEKICNLLVHFTLLSKHRCMELIEDSCEVIADVIAKYVADKDIGVEKIDKKHMDNYNIFLEFIGNQDCLGRLFFSDGLTTLNLEDLSNFIDFELDLYVDSLFKINDAKAALDILSILLLCRDSWEMPMIKFKQNSSLFSSNLEHVTKLSYMLLAMLGDFNAFRESKGKQVNG